MKDLKFSLEVHEKKYDFCFNLNAMEEIQEEYGTIEKWGDLLENGDSKEPNIKALLFGFKAMLNEAIEIENETLKEKKPLLTSKQVGRIVSSVGIELSAQKMKDAIIESTKSDEKN